MSQAKGPGKADAARRTQLFSEFEPATSDDWRAEAERFLKGADLEERLVTRTDEGVTLNPIYGEEDAAGLLHVGHFPGFAPFVRGVRTIRRAGEEWMIAQERRCAAPEEANREARADLAREGGAFNVLVARDGREGVRLDGLEDMERLLDGIDLIRVPVYLHVGAEALPFLTLLAAYLDRHGLAPDILDGALAVDPIGALGADGTISLPLESALDGLAHAAAWASARAPGLGTVWVHGEVFHESGGSAVQELALSLATAVDYLRALDDRGVNAERAASHFRFSLALGSRFFMEVAKLRAARLLWHRVLDTCGVSAEKRTLWMHGATSRFTSTSYDPHVNMLRATTQAFAGVVGGVDSLHTDPFDHPLDTSDAFSRRVAMNTQLVLRDEAHAARVNDPAGGSWYVERLTDDLARAAWSLFQDVERRGGMTRALDTGFVQDSVDAVARNRRDAFARGREVLVGTNKYPETGSNRLAVPVGRREQPSPPSGRKERIRPLTAARCAEPLELLRAAVESHGDGTGRLRVFLATLGDAAACRARIDFAASFFEIGGFETIRAGAHTGDDNSDTDETARVALDSGAPVVVFCGTDEEYAQGAVDLAGRLGARNPALLIALAGKPRDDAQADAFRAAKIDLFVHLDADRLETLGRVARSLGVKP